MSTEALIRGESFPGSEPGAVHGYGSFVRTSNARLGTVNSCLSAQGMVAIIIRCSAEFLGCLIFIYMGSLSATGTIGNPSVVNPAFAHGICIAVLIIGLGHISGGHFNPAVTTGVLVSGEIHVVLAIFYWIAQLSGGFVGALLVRASIRDSVYLAIAGGTTNISIANVTVAEAIVMEAVLTFLLVHTVLNAAVDSGGANVLAPLGIGLALLVSIFAGGTSTGASLNPARSFGPALGYQIFEDCDNKTGCMTAADVWKYHYVHWVGPIIGGIVAGIVYKLLFAKTGKRWILN